MAEILRVTARWSGLPGGNGYTVLHFRDFSSGSPTTADAQAAVDRVDDFFAAIIGLIPATVTILVLPDVEVIEETNNTLQSVLTAVPDAARTGGATGAASFVAAAGAVISWRTGGIRANRRVRGRTFLIPLSSQAFQSDGTLLSTALTTLNTAATALRNNTGTPDLGIYARPTATGATDGVWFAVTSHSIPDMGAILRSRRA